MISMHAYFLVFSLAKGSANKPMEYKCDVDTYYFNKYCIDVWCLLLIVCLYFFFIGHDIRHII